MFSCTQCQVNTSVAGVYFCTALTPSNIIVLHPAGNIGSDIFLLKIIHSEMHMNFVTFFM